MRNDLRKLALEQSLTNVLLTFTSKLENRCFMFVLCAKSGGVVGSDDDAVRALRYIINCTWPYGDFQG